MRLSIRQHLRHRGWLGSGPACLALWICGIAVLEVGGRKLESPYADALGVLILGGFSFATLVWHVLSPVGFLTRAALWTRRRFRKLGSGVPEFAVDYREDPPVPRAFPRPLRLGVLVLGALFPVLLLGAASLPGLLRDVVAGFSYTLWVALLGGLWALLIAGIVLMLACSVRAMHAIGPQLFGSRPGRGKRGDLGGAAALLLLLVGAPLLLPDWVALGTVLVLLSSNLIALHLPGNSTITWLWMDRSAEGGPAQRSIQSHQAIALQLTLLVFLVCDLVLLTRGDRLGIGFGPGSTGAAPVTALLGLLFLWMAVGGLILGSIEILRFVFLSRSLADRVSVTPSLFVHGVVSPRTRDALVDLLKLHGWEPRFEPENPRPDEVQVRLSTPRTREDELAFFDVWPLEAAACELGTAELQHKLRRRLEMLERRNLRKGLRKLFKIASRRRPSAGHGYWLGIQHWFEPGMSRDVEMDADDERISVFDPIVGPPFSRIFSRGARRYFREVMGALEVDLLFVEDGLGYKRFERVLRVLFETFDIHGGNQRVEEMHFVGLPGVRVVIHDHRPGKRIDTGTDYPEPDYEDIARARILHVFRDRGGQEEFDAIPDFFTDLPVPLASF